MLEILIKRIKEISGKECKCAFVNDNNYTSLLGSGGRFILEPESQESRSIGISHRKEKTRKVRLFYGKMNNPEIGPLKEVIEIESFLDELEKDKELLKHIINLDHYYTIHNEKLAEKNRTGLITFEINLDIKER